MNYAIEHELIDYPFLTITPRKKVLKNCLMMIKQGLVLIKLGKREFTVESGQVLWVPFDCLTSLTYFTNTQVQQVSFSVRLAAPFPTQAGVVDLTPLSLAVLNKLQQMDLKSDAHEAHQHDLLNVLKVDIQTFAPQLHNTPLSEAINAWHAEDDNEPSPLFDKSQLLVLTLREAKKRLQSGQKRATVIEALFAGETEEFELLWQLCFGDTL